MRDISVRERRGLFRRERRIRMLCDEYLRCKSERTTETNPRTLSWGKHSGLTTQIVCQSHLRASSATRARISGVMSSTATESGSARFCSTVNCSTSTARSVSSPN